MRESGLRLHLVTIIYLAAKLTVTDQTITSLIKNAKIGTNCLWKHMGYWESSRNQAERVACFTSRTVTENNLFSFASLPPFKKRILCWHIYPSLPFNSILIKHRLIIKYIFKNFQCCFYHNPNFSQTLKKKSLKKKKSLEIQKCEENTFCFVNGPVTFLGCDWGCYSPGCLFSQCCHSCVKGGEGRHL